VIDPGADCLRNGDFVLGRYTTNCGGCNVTAALADVKARVMRLATDGPLLLKASYLRLLLVIPTHSLKGPSLPELALNRIDAIFFSHVAVCRTIRSFTPETLLDLL